MGMFDLSNKEKLRILYEINKFQLNFSNDNIDESASFYTTGKAAITIYIRSKKEANTSHWCSVKAYKGGRTSSKSKEGMCSYLVNGMNKPINSIDEIQLDKHCDSKAKKFDKDYGKIVRTFIMCYQEEIIEYWEAEDINTMADIETKIRSTLSSNGFNLI